MLPKCFKSAIQTLPFSRLTMKLSMAHIHTKVGPDQADTRPNSDNDRTLYCYPATLLGLVSALLGPTFVCM